MMTTTRTRTDAGLATALRISVSRLARRLRAQRTTSGMTEAVLSETQLAALSALEVHQAMTPGELAEHEKVQPPSMTRVIAVQEMGLVVERRSAEADVERGVFAGVGRGLYEEVTHDRRTGRIVGGPHWRRMADAPRVEVRLEEKVQAVLRLGPEAPGVLAAVSNAVHNAIGVRVPGLPMTPDRVLAALAKGG